MVSQMFSPSRAIRRPRRLDLRVVIGILLALVAVFGSLTFWSSAVDTRAILVATRDLPAGATLSTGDLATARVRLDDALYAAAIPADDLNTLLGTPLAEPVHAHQMIVRPQLAGGPLLAADQLAMTIAVKSETAVGGRLKQGDAVQVLLTTNGGKPESRTTVVLPRVTVYSVGYDQRLAAVSPGGGTASGAPSGGIAAEATGPLASLTLIVTPEQALQLAAAKWNGDLDVALLPPLPATPSPATTR